MYRTLLLIFIVAALAVPAHIVSAQEASVNPNGTVDDRLRRAMTEQQVSLDATAQANVQAKCQNAQVQLSNIQRPTESLIRKRIDTYSSLQKELIAIQLRMVRQGADASEIDLLTGKIQQALDDFTIAADAYGTSLNDAVVVNCVEKPEQFRAGVLLMRIKRAELLQASTALKNIMLSAPLNTYEPLKNRMVF